MASATALVGRDFSRWLYVRLNSANCSSREEAINFSLKLMETITGFKGCGICQRMP